MGAACPITSSVARTCHWTRASDDGSLGKRRGTARKFWPYTAKACKISGSMGDHVTSSLDRAIIISQVTTPYRTIGETRVLKDRHCQVRKGFGKLDLYEHITFPISWLSISSRDYFVCG